MSNTYENDCNWWVGQMLSVQLVEQNAMNTYMISKKMWLFDWFNKAIWLQTSGE